jgi:hypothetical protein
MLVGQGPSGHFFPLATLSHSVTGDLVHGTEH